MHMAGLLGWLLGGTLAFARLFGAVMLAAVFNATTIVVTRRPTIALAMMALALPVVSKAL